jgi:hypothetical protein
MIFYFIFFFPLSTLTPNSPPDVFFKLRRMFDCKNQIFFPSSPAQRTFFLSSLPAQSHFFNPAEQVWKKQKEKGGSH